MENKKFYEIIKSIEADMRELAEETGSCHISAFVIDGRFSIDDYSDLKNPKFSYFNKGADDE